MRGAFAKHRRSDFSLIFFDLWFFCKVCEPLKVLRLLAKTEVRPFALRDESLAPCNLKKPRKSTKNGHKSHLGAARATFFNRLWSLKAARSRDLKRLGATRTTWRATRSDQVDRSGSVGVGRVVQVARGPPSRLAEFE